MKIIYRKGDLLEAPLDIIVHGCNIYGAMGAGIALQIKKKYPEVYEVYRDLHEVHGLYLGQIQIATAASGRTIINAMTQKWQVDYEALERCFEQINTYLGSPNQDVFIGMPRIGAGLGGGEWSIISEIIERVSWDFQPIVYDL